MLIEVLIYGNVALGRKLGKAMKIAKSQGHNPDKTEYFHSHFKAFFSMVKLTLDSKTPLRAIYIFIDGFMRVQRK